MDRITRDEAVALLILITGSQGHARNQYSARFVLSNMLTKSQRKVFKRAISKPWVRGWNWGDIYASAFAHATTYQEVKREGGLQAGVEASGSDCGLQAGVEASGSD